MSSLGGGGVRQVSPIWDTEHFVVLLWGGRTGCSQAGTPSTGFSQSSLRSRPAAGSHQPWQSHVGTPRA